MMEDEIINDAIEDQKIRIHKDHRTWTSDLEFYTSEIRFFNMELEQVLLVNYGDLSIVEHVKEYQDILKKKSLKLIELQEEIKFQRKIFDMDEIVPENISYHLILTERIENFVQNFEKVKKNLKRYASRRD